MQLISPRTLHILRNPVVFARQVLKAFRANQGMLLAGAVTLVMGADHIEDGLDMVQK